MVIKNVVSYEWRGNVMVMLNEDNSFRMMQLHTNRLEVTVGPPVSLFPKPPEFTLDCAAISMSDQVGCLLSPLIVNLTSAPAVGHYHCPRGWQSQGPGAKGHGPSDRGLGEGRGEEEADGGGEG